jgi:8-oxo-dGTP pyrophosphatase MutT (NUDIX family)
MSYLARIQDCNGWNPAQFRPWRIAGQGVGWLHHDFAEELEQWPEVFRVERSGVDLVSELASFESRTLALRGVTMALVAAGRISHTHGEPYPVTPGGREQALCTLDRAAAAYFGIRAFGQHINGYVHAPDGLRMWIGRRARDRRLFPGLLDNLVAGGLPHGVSLHANLLKECWEEAAMPASLAARAKGVGTVSYIKETAKGLKPDILYCYDLELPEDFVPRCTDGEVERFALWPIAQVAEMVRDTEAFKPNCNLVIIDFLVRHGLLDAERVDYPAIVEGLHVALGQAG